MISRVARYIALFLVLCLLFNGCTQEQATTQTHRSPPQIGFYHWQQRLVTDSLPLYLLTDQQKPELIVRCFDVDMVEGAPQATSILSVSDDSLAFELIPIIFITNRVMRQTDQTEREQLANDLLALLTEILGNIGSQSSNADKKFNADFPYRELQIDCDWTANTRSSYFEFLELLKSKLPQDITLTATVRLHQFRDRKLQGIPPADRGVLMAYNVGELSNWATENSIIDTTLTAAYLRPDDPLPPYPIPLDLVLPHYEWAVVYRQGKLAYLLEGGTATLLTNPNRFEKLTSNRYRVIEDSYLNGYFLYKNDLIRLESVETDQLISLGRQFKAATPGFSGQRWLFYRMRSSLTQQRSAAYFRDISKRLFGNRVGSTDANR